jgi:hypothetical protein
VLLFPQPDARPLEEWRDAGQPLTLVVPDGTWRQDNKARRRVEGLADLPCATLPPVESFLQDVRFAFRQLRQSAGFTALAIITLAFTIGSWVLDFTLAGQPGLLDWLSRLSMTQVLRPFEQGLFSVGLLVGVVGVICAFATLAGIWLPPGLALRTKLARSAACIAAAVLVLLLASQIATSFDVTEDRRNSFAHADEQALAALNEPLVVTVHLAPEDPRYVDLRRDVLSKLQRVMPNVTIRLLGGRQIFATGSTDEAYGQIELAFGTHGNTTRSSSPGEILPLLYGLAGREPPAPGAGSEYPGYPLIANGDAALAWYFGGLPLLIVIGWWWSRRPPLLRHIPVLKEIQP